MKYIIKFYNSSLILFTLLCIGLFSSCNKDTESTLNSLPNTVYADIVKADGSYANAAVNVGDTERTSDVYLLRASISDKLSQELTLTTIIDTTLITEFVARLKAELVTLRTQLNAKNLEADTLRTTLASQTTKTDSALTQAKIKVVLSDSATLQKQYDSKAISDTDMIALPSNLYNVEKFVFQPGSSKLNLPVIFNSKGMDFAKVYGLGLKVTNTSDASYKILNTATKVFFRVSANNTTSGSYPGTLYIRDQLGDGGPTTDYPNYMPNGYDLTGKVETSILPIDANKSKLVDPFSSLFGGANVIIDASNRTIVWEDVAQMTALGLLAATPLEILVFDSVKKLFVYKFSYTNSTGAKRVIVSILQK